MTAITRPEVFRQSLLQGFTTCPRRTMHSLKVDGDLPTGWVGHTGQLGTAFHAFMEKYLRTLGQQDAEQMSTQEGIECMYEALAELPFVLPWDAYDELRWLVLSFCDYRWNPKLLASADYETELRAEVVCPDGEIRIAKGTPDVLMFDPPTGLLIPDAKSGRGRPKGPRTEPEPGEILEDRKYLSDLFQGETYCFLALRKYPAAQYAVFKEFHIRSGQIRQIRVTRDDLEHIERKLGVLMMRLDEAIGEGEGSKLWSPRPGSHCARQCPVARSCPVPVEQRGEGGIEDDLQANAAAQALAVLEGKRAALLGSLKSRAEDPANSLPRVNEREVYAWKPPTGKGRRFGLHQLADLVSTTEEGEA